ncbi:hypothetical protein D1F64_16670 [Breoghania sp. L-A4]|nr:hypothetical protein D1F64_16670 [Breoghania sp. L-A4]
MAARRPLGRAAPRSPPRPSPRQPPPRQHQCGHRRRVDRSRRGDRHRLRAVQPVACPSRVSPRSPPAPWSNDWYAYCGSKYRSFNPRTGYFQSYSGDYVFCR